MDVRVQGVAKTYPDGTRALEAVEFSIAPGQGVVILGANGCGKSTLLRAMLGLEPLTAGDIVIDGTSVPRARPRQLRALRGRIGSVFQQFNLVSNLSVFQNVLFGRLARQGFWRSLGPLATRAARADAMAALERVGLASLAGRRTDTLSGGQQQRVAIARMLMQDAGLVLADEPVASLDPKAGREVMDLLFEIGRERGLTVLCVLHQLDLARRYADRIIGLRGGRVVLDAAPSAIAEAQFSALYETDAARPGAREVGHAA